MLLRLRNGRRAFLAAKVFSSPSRRTVQTTLLALKGHPALSEGSVNFRADLRKCAACRDNIARGGSPSHANRSGLEKDGIQRRRGQCTSRWWRGRRKWGGRQRRADHDSRTLLRSALADQLPLEGFRCLFRGSGDCAFARGKIANCGVVAVDVAIDKPPGRRLEAPELLFGGTFSSVDSRASLLEAIRRRRSRSGDVSGG